MRLYSAARAGVNLTLSPAKEVVKRSHMIIHTACTEQSLGWSLERTVARLGKAAAPRSDGFVLGGEEATHSLRYPGRRRVMMAALAGDGARNLGNLHKWASFYSRSTRRST